MDVKKGRVREKITRKGFGIETRKGKNEEREGG